MNKLIILITLALASGCLSNKTTSIRSPIPMESYDEEVLKAKAESLNMKYEDYIKNLKNGEISVLRGNPVFYQAYDEKWYSDPTINPIFDEEWEAREYAKRNSMSQGSFAYSGHDYIVRVINYRYEVRRVNDEENDILHTSNDFNDAYEYVVEYSSSHADLIIYDLKTGKSFEETP